MKTASYKAEDYVDISLKTVLYLSQMLQNHTHYPTKDIVKLRAFLEKRIYLCYRTSLVIQLAEVPAILGAAFTGGVEKDDWEWMLKKRLEIENPQDLYFSLAAATYEGSVQLFMPLFNKPYPRITRLDQKTPKVTLGSWQDEILLVLAHEYEHLARCWNDDKAPGGLREEILVEKRAVKHLQAYQEQK